MKAVVCRELNKPVSVEDVQVDKPRAGEVMVRLVASGVCHSDLSVTNGTLPIPRPWFSDTRAPASSRR